MIEKNNATRTKITVHNEYWNALQYYTVVLSPKDKHSMHNYWCTYLFRFWRCMSGHCNFPDVYIYIYISSKRKPLLDSVSSRAFNPSFIYIHKRFTVSFLLFSLFWVRNLVSDFWFLQFKFSGLNKFLPLRGFFGFLWFVSPNQNIIYSPLEPAEVLYWFVICRSFT